MRKLLVSIPVYDTIEVGIEVPDDATTEEILEKATIEAADKQPLTSWLVDKERIREDVNTFIIEETRYLASPTAADRTPEAKAKRKELEKEYGQVWDTHEVQQDYEVLDFLSPRCFVRRKSDGKKGTLRFIHDPRFYYDFQEEDL